MFKATEPKIGSFGLGRKQAGRARSNRGLWCRRAGRKHYYRGFIALLSIVGAASSRDFFRVKLNIRDLFNRPNYLNKEDEPKR